MKDKKKYPTQYDAESLADWFWNANKVFLGGASKEIRKAFYECENVRLKMHQEVFGNNSPWSMRKLPNGKPQVYWDHNKAKKLGL